MLTLRLQRVGRKHDPSYRIVATNSRNGPKASKHVAVLGHYDAIRKTTVIKDAEEVKKHLAHGAQVTDTLHNILVGQGIIDGKKKNVLPKKSPIVDEQAAAAAKAAEEEKAAAATKAAQDAEDAANAAEEATEEPVTREETVVEEEVGEIATEEEPEVIAEEPSTEEKTEEA